MRRCYGLLLCCLLAACSSQETEPSQTTALEILPLSFSALDEQHRPQSRYLLPEQMILTLAAIPGSFTGDAVAESVMGIEVDRDRIFVLDFSDIRAEIKSYSRPLQVTDSNRDLQLEPADTRFVRLGTFVMTTEKYAQIGATGISQREGESVNWQMLAYFDRPCRLTGSTWQGGERMEYDLEIPAAGFWLLNTIDTDENHHKVVAAGYQRQQHHISVVLNGLAGMSI